MLATLIDAPFDDEKWLFEIKWDGYRALAHKSKKIELLSRNALSFNARFPEIVDELKKIKGSFIVDGEIVILDEKGKSQFQLLQNYQKEKKGTPYYYLFDLLSLNGKSLIHLPLIERKKRLKALLAHSSFSYLKYSDHLIGKGKRVFQKALKLGLEGIIAKRMESPYQMGRSSDWLKIKTSLRQEVVIGGFTEPKGARKKFGSLLIGVYEKGVLRYIGHVGGGFNEALLEKVYAQLKKSICSDCPFHSIPKTNGKPTWVKPKLVCEVSFAEWTKEGSLRQPIFKGMRIDKKAKEVIREKAKRRGK